MQNETTAPDAVTPEATKRRRRPVRRGSLLALGALLVVVALAMTAVAYWLDSDSGHEFLIKRVEAIEPENGMRIGIGAIKGSIYREMEIVDLALSDPKGVFFQAGSVTVDWNPLAWIFNELYISDALVTQARLDRLPKFIDTEKDGPLLPGFNIYLGAFKANDLILGKAVTGEEQQADLTGALDIRAGRAMVIVDAATTRSGDKIALRLNAEPERERLDLNADITAPAEGVIARYLGFKQDFSMSLSGKGDWAKWDGELLAISADQQLAAVASTLR